MSDHARRVLLALADLVDASPDDGEHLAVPEAPFDWLSSSAAVLFDPSADHRLAYRKLPENQMPRYAARLHPPKAQQLAMVDAVRPERHSLYVGWLWVQGSLSIDGALRRVMHPLVVIAVRVVGYRLLPAAEPFFTPRITDHDVRERLVRQHWVPVGSPASPLSQIPQWLGLGTAPPSSQRPSLGGIVLRASYFHTQPDLQTFALEVAREAGLAITAGWSTLQAPPYFPTDRAERVLLPHLAVFSIESVGGLGWAPAMRSWINQVGRPSAFRLVFDRWRTGAHRPPRKGRGSGVEVRSPVPLTRAQRAVVSSAREAPITVVSGAPGTGKSQAIVAAALDVATAGQSVLVTAGSDAGVAALVALFTEADGPRPVVFGGEAERIELITRLREPVLPTSRDQLDHAVAHVVAAAARVADGRENLEAARSALRTASHAARREAWARTAFPRLFELEDLSEVEDDLERAAGRGRGATRAWQRLVERLDVPPEAELPDLRDAFEAARWARRARPAAPVDDPSWLRLAEAEQDERASVAEWMHLDARSARRLAELADRSTLSNLLMTDRVLRRTELSRRCRTGSSISSRSGSGPCTTSTTCCPPSRGCSTSW